jgi:phosphate transport system permease protein
MTDAAISASVSPVQRRLDVTSDAALARVRRRYRAESRFRFYGLAAIAFAAVFLVVLLADIVIKALPAFTQMRLFIDVPVSAEKVDPKSPRSGDFDAVVRDGLRALFPSVTSRADRKALSDVLSSGAADRVRAMVVADPSLIGGTVKAPVLLSSDADLYLKGLSTGRLVEAGAGIASPSGTTGSIVVSSTSNTFAEQLLKVKEAMARHGADLRRENDRFALNLRSIEADLTAAEARLEKAKSVSDGPLIANLGVQIAALKDTKGRLESKLAEDRAKVDDLAKRYERAGSSETLDSKVPTVLVAINGGIVKATNIASDHIDGEVLVPLSSTADAPSGSWQKILLDRPEDSRKIQDRQVAFLEKLKELGAVQSVPNFPFFTSGDSREPELAGILGALAGSAFTMLVTLALCLPIGVGAAIYLEEFAPKNRLTELIEVNINNLAAVPSIVFGLLGLAMFLNFFGMPRSSPLVGGLVLALLVLPTIIIASRAALKAVPPSIREAALGIGASKQQAIFHHVLPLAMPGVLTGTIIGMAHALGESAPLLMIGMIAFIVDVPTRVTEAATVLPVQIFLWSDLPEVGFKAKTAAAIIVLLMFLFVMNGLAIWLRKRFERRW